MDSKNRLQFRHHKEVFENREQAIAYIMAVSDNSIRDAETGLAAKDENQKFSLFAEPTVLAYKNEDDVKNPHLIVVIGSRTNDTRQFYENRFCVIDVAKIDEDIQDLNDKIEEAISALSLKTEDSNTLDLEAVKTDDGTFISGNVILSEYEIYDNMRKENVIIETENGLYSFIDLSYDENNDELKFQVNGNSKVFEIDNNYITGGTYSREDESLHLNSKHGDEIVISLENLIDEWTVLGEASETPIVLTKETYGYGDTDASHNHVEPWQDVLKADVRLLDKAAMPTNILEKTTDGRYLFVDGRASNITYYVNGEKTNVKAVLDDLVKIGVSNDNENIIYEKSDGFFASAKLSYDMTKNELSFKTSNKTGGTSETKITLNSVKIFNDIYYDSLTETLILTYTDETGQIRRIQIPIGQMIEEWEPLNEGHSVKIVRSRSVGGKDKVSADVKLRVDPVNILEDYNHELIVRGVASNIKYGLSSTVEEEINRLHSTDNTQESHLTKLDNTIGSGFTDDANGNVTAEFERLESKVDDEITRATSKENDIETALNTEAARAEAAENVLGTKIDDEISRSTSIDDAHETRLNTIDATIGSGFTTDTHETITYLFNELSSKTDSEIARSISKDEALDAEVAHLTDVDEEHEARLNTIDATIGSGFTTDTHETITYLFNELSSKTDSEITRSTNEDAALDAKVDAEISRAEAAENVLNDKIDEVNKDRIITVKDTLSVGLTIEPNTGGASGSSISADVKLSSFSGNILSIDANTDGVLATVDLDYDESENKLTLSRNNMALKTIYLASSIKNIYYDANTEELVIVDVYDGAEVERRIPLRDLIHEVSVDSAYTENAIRLRIEHNHESGTSAGPDIIYADAIVSLRPDNILEIVHDSTGDGCLYVSNNSITANTSAITAEVNRAVSVEGILAERIDNEFVRASNVENALSGAISDETSRAMSVEEALSDKIDTDVNAEAGRAISAETALDDRIHTLENGINGLSVADTNTVNMDLTDYVISSDVKISSVSGNVLSNSYNDGLYADVRLEYDAAQNKLKLLATNTNSERVIKDDIQLNAGALLDNIIYSSETRTLIMVYHTNDDPTPQYVEANLEELIKAWDVESNGHSVTLKKDDSDILTADVKISEDEDNILVVQDNCLLVKGVASNIAYENTNLEETLDTIISDIQSISGGGSSSDSKINALSGLVETVINSDGLYSDGTYHPYAGGGGTISGANSLMDADKMLTDAFASISGKIDSILISGDTYSTHMYTEDDGLYKRFKTDVRMSHGVWRMVTDDELIVKDYSGQTIEGADTALDGTIFELGRTDEVGEVVEEDTNVLRLIYETIDRSTGARLYDGNEYNGLYLSNIWHCGLYTEGGAGTFKNRYKTDTDASTYGYDYNNNARQ